jgi:hypothetical protein
MAIDTASKRRSILGITSPTVRPIPFPDGTISQGDRQHFALMYSGILWGTVVPTVSGPYRAAADDSHTPGAEAGGAI